MAPIPTGTTTESAGTERDTPREDGQAPRDAGSGTKPSDSGSDGHQGGYQTAEQLYNTAARNTDDIVTARSGAIGQLFADLASEFGEIIVERIGRGPTVSDIPPTAHWIPLAKGWVAKMIYSGGIRDVWIKMAYNYSKLPAHSHPQTQHVYVVSGSLKITIEGKQQTLYEGEAVIIHPDEEHQMEGNVYGDTMLIVVYEPPMMH